MAEEATYVMRPVRVKNENALPIGGGRGGAGTRDLLFTIGAIGVGAIGGYFVVDYIMKNKLLESILPAPDGNGVPVEEDTQADVAKITPLFGYQSQYPREEYDRTTRVNSYATRKFTQSKKPVVVEDAVDIPSSPDVVMTIGEFNQIVTDNDVYNYT